MKQILYLTVFIVTLLSGASISADTIYLNDGKKISGDIVAVSKEYFAILLDKAVSPQTYFLHQIKAVKDAMNREDFDARGIEAVVRSSGKYFTLKDLGEDVVLIYHLAEIDDLEQLNEEGILMHKLFWADQSEDIAWGSVQSDPCTLPENKEICEQNKANFKHNEKIYNKILETEDPSLCKDFVMDEALTEKCYDTFNAHLAAIHKNVSYCDEIVDVFIKDACIEGVVELERNPDIGYKPFSYAALSSYWGENRLGIKELHKR